MCEVNRFNFDQFYPNIEEDIRAASFVGLDAEFSGLLLSDKYRNSLFDTARERYTKLKKTVSQITLLQIGLSIYIEGDHGDRPNTYKSHTYNFSLFPAAFGPVDTRFIIQSSSVEFLCKHKFDFNKFAYEGVTFINGAQEKCLAQYLSSQQHFAGTDRDVDERLLQQCCSQVADWAVQESKDDHMTLAVPDGIDQYVLLTEIRHRFPDVWADSTEDGQLAVKKLPEVKKKALLEETRRDEQEKIMQRILGFRRVFNLLVQHKKPLVAHNCLMDFLLIYDKFHQPLPESYEVFKADLHSLFPHIYDTKHISANLRRPMEESGLMESTNLADLYHSLSSQKGQFYAIHSPSIAHGDGFLKYKNHEHVHEAGYDAHMCCYVYLRMAHLVATHGIKSGNVNPMRFSEYMAALQPFCNSINVIRGAVDHLNLAEADPASRRPQWLFVRSKSSGVYLKPSQLAQLFSAYGSVDIQMQSARQALVAVGNHRCAKDIMSAFKKDKRLVVARYRMWKHSPVVRGLLWAGMLVSGGALVWTVVSIMKPSSNI